MGVLILSSFYLDSFRANGLSLSIEAYEPLYPLELRRALLPELSDNRSIILAIFMALAFVWAMLVMVLGAFP